MMQQKQAKVEIRCSFEEKSAWQEAAGGARQVSRWMRDLANAESKRLSGLSTFTSADVPNTSWAFAQTASPVALPSGKCPRWMHHRPGVYCGTCKKVSK